MEAFHPPPWHGMGMRPFRLGVRLAALPLACVLMATAGVAPAGPHERRAAPGAHPRLFASPAEIEALRAKVAAPGTLSARLFAHAVEGLPTPGIPDYVATLHATAPMASLLLPTADARSANARAAIDTALAIVRKWDPPYPDDPEWIEWFLYRYVAIAYDACHDAMTEAEREEVREELVRIAALAAAFGVETTANNHWTVAAVVLGLAALAIEGDVSEEPRLVRDEVVVRGALTPAGDFLAVRSGFRVDSVGLADGNGTTRYVQGRDFDVRWIKDSDAGFAIVWKAGGSAPAPKAEYRVTYVFTPDVPTWKELARLAIQRNLDHVWADGASLAGVLYGSFTLWWAVDLFEAFRRAGIADFGTHPCVRGIVAWLMSELLPGEGLRTNDRNDSSIDGGIDGLARATAFLAWATKRYHASDTAAASGQEDPAVAAGAAWLLSRGREGLETSSWREALWWDDAAGGPPPLVPPAPPDFPLSRFFRGHDLASFRTGAWAGPTDEGSLFTLTSGPLTMAEHDQTDKGSFTFYALGEDFAVDSGYAQGDARSDSTAAHSYVLVDGKGQAGAWGSFAVSRSHHLSASFDAAHADLKGTYVHYGQWLRQDPGKPWPMAAADRCALFLKSEVGGSAVRAPVVVLFDVMDAIDRDGAPHLYEWLLHTRDGNGVAIEAGGKGDTGRATIEGRVAGGTCAVHLAAAAAPALRRDDWTPVSGKPHPRLVASVTAVDPRFLAILVPERKGEVAPRVVTFSQGKGHRAATIVDGPRRDLVVACLGSEAKALELETDAALALVRLDEKAAVAGWAVFSGNHLRHRGRTLFAVAGPKGARADAFFGGGNLSIAGPDVLEWSAWAPGAKSFRNRGPGGDGEVPLAAPGETVRWKGKRPLADAWPAGTPALAEDFSGGASPYWFVWPAGGTGFTRVVADESADGEGGVLCVPGIRPEWISWTHRNFNRNPFQMGGPPRADVLSWPRFRYGDAVLTGTFAVVSADATRPGATLTISGRVVDRTYPDDDAVAPDQDRVQVRLDPARKEAALSILLDGVLTPAGVAKGLDLSPGSRHSYEWNFSGNSVTFTLDGTPRLRHTAKRLPPVGYFQWEVGEGLHVHLDDMKVALPSPGG